MDRFIIITLNGYVMGESGTGISYTLVPFRAMQFFRDEDVKKFITQWGIKQDCRVLSIDERINDYFETLK